MSILEEAKERTTGGPCILRGLGYVQPAARVHRGNPGSLEPLTCVHSGPTVSRSQPRFINKFWQHRLGWPSRCGV